jgi:hypothetical protein
MQLIWVSGLTARVQTISITARTITAAAIGVAVFLLAMGFACHWVGLRVAIELNPSLAQRLGGVTSASVYRLAPLGFADADPDTEMVNLALPSPGLTPFAWQSSLPPASGGSANWGGFPARAIDNARYPDGNIKTGYWDGSCTHTAPGDSNPWWGVDLGEVSTIHALRLYQRTDCCIGRFAGMVIYLSNTNASAPGRNPWDADGRVLPLTIVLADDHRVTDL